MSRFPFPIVVYFNINRPTIKSVAEAILIFQFLHKKINKPQPAIGTAIDVRVPDINKPYNAAVVTNM